MWFDLLKMLVTIAQHKKEVNIADRMRVSKAYSQMSELLVETVKELRSDVYPHGKCAAMATLAENVIDYLKHKINQNELELIQDMFQNCTKLEKEFAMRHDPETIKVLFEAAGRLQALSILYSV